MRICHIVASLEERYGGPSKSVCALAKAQAALGHDVSLLATGENGPEKCAEGSLQIRSFPRDWPSRIARSADLRRHLFSISPEVIHHHALWQRPLHYAHRRAAALNAPLVISPRGMMSGWAWQHHRTRKSLARALVHPSALEATNGWHATSAEEIQDIRAHGFHQPACFAPNGVDAPSAAETAAAADYWREACPEVEVRPTALFYSRLHQKKRVLELIDLWLEDAPPSWLLLIVGLPDEFTVAQLERYVLRASGGNRVRIFDGSRRPPPYAIASLFLLPSHSENFGLAIAEAMAHGVPVVVTDSTPWGHIKALGAGWCVPWAEYPGALKAALAEPPGRRADRGEVGRVHVLAEYSWQRCASSLLIFYRELLGRHD